MSHEPRATSSHEPRTTAATATSHEPQATTSHGSHEPRAASHDPPSRGSVVAILCHFPFPCCRHRGAIFVFRQSSLSVFVLRRSKKRRPEILVFSPVRGRTNFVTRYVEMIVFSSLFPCNRTELARVPIGSFPRIFGSPLGMPVRSLRDSCFY